MTIHDVPPLHGPRLFIGGEWHGRVEKVPEDHNRLRVMPPRNLLTNLTPEPVTYNLHFLLSIFLTPVPVFVWEGIANDPDAMDQALLTTRYAVALSPYA